MSFQFIPRDPDLSINQEQRPDQDAAAETLGELLTATTGEDFADALIGSSSSDQDERLDQVAAENKKTAELGELSTTTTGEAFVDALTGSSSSDQDQRLDRGAAETLEELSISTTEKVLVGRPLNDSAASASNVEQPGQFLFGGGSTWTLNSSAHSDGRLLRQSISELGGLIANLDSSVATLSTLDARVRSMASKQ
jgi:hypothetical protein